MSRYNPNHPVAEILAAAEQWKSVALLGRRSLFSDGQVWTDENIRRLKEYFVDRPDEGDGTFMDKLERQLTAAGQGAQRLAAEMTWLMLLCPSSIGAASKRESIRVIWGWSGSELPTDHPLLSDKVLDGLGSAGTAFNTARWRELRYCVRIVEAFRAADGPTQQSLLTDGWAMAAWLEQLPEGDRRQFRHMLLYLLFPDQFERIFGGKDRKAIAQAIRGYPRDRVGKMRPLEIDKELLAIRDDAERALPGQLLDFYVSPLREKWKSTGPEDTDEDTERDDAGDSPLASITREGVLRVLDHEARGTEVREEVPRQYDLVRGSRRFAPQQILHQAGAAVGLDLPKQEPAAAESSPGYKHLRQLGFHLETQTFLIDLVSKFLDQAGDGESLVVSGYPKTYRGLSVQVSFGKGNLARVPWVSFTGFEQTTSHGIYPVLLFYKSVDLLVLAYGISETTHPKESWAFSKTPQTIAAAFEQQGLEKPARYGDSFVAGVYKVGDDIDLRSLQRDADRVIGEYIQQFEAHRPTAVAVSPAVVAKRKPYTLTEASEGLFVDEAKLKNYLALLRRKKNLILQGPPGVGKTFVVRRLAFALMGEEAADRLQMVQFHQAYSYEDFIQGFRPSGSGFRLKNGVFYEFCEKARNDPGATYVFAIDEINRGNLSKVLGEVMMLIEPDKRSSQWAIPLTYSESGDNKFFVPDNVHLIGMMNTADRSLALVDYALRRRFAFADIEPAFESDAFYDYLASAGVAEPLIDVIVERMSALNQSIASDTANLGPGFRIGHSYFSDVPRDGKADWQWYLQIVRSEIEPLLREYYFDNAGECARQVSELVRSA